MIFHMILLVNSTMFSDMMFFQFMTAAVCDIGLYRK